MRLWHGDFYAAQTFSNTPDGRRVQIGWGRGIVFPDMPFNQQMTVPCSLTLRPTEEGVRLHAEPVAELAKLRVRSHSWKDLIVKPGETPLSDVASDLYEIHAEVKVGNEGAFQLTVRGVPIVYDARQNTLTCGQHTMPLTPKGGVVRLVVLVDRGSVEVFGNAGRVALSRESFQRLKIDLWRS